MPATCPARSATWKRPGARRAARRSSPATAITFASTGSRRTADAPPVPLRSRAGGALNSADKSPRGPSSRAASGLQCSILMNDAFGRPLRNLRLSVTANGVLLADQVDALKSAGLGRITVSLDTLHPDRFIRLTRFDQLDAVHAGIAAARRAFGRLKIDTVVIRGVNDDELVPLIEYGRSVNGEIRF